ncbi:Hypothetical protein R9X50_00327000 [Acrodontium crateriforme]|uniref:SMP-30/Gluconolactonase/LRE-like region domain-containing protein n=1 Tax=Acrodontium crateriforme TaxID=150365 RepID=A0AAQ3R442_9PEZI|nr:Hypothetical protein R9X50_00327000 [Acrodontium crateriforme]
MELPPNCKRISREERTIASSSTRSNAFQPHFAVYDDEFLDIIGPEPQIVLAIEKDFPFSHEAGVFDPTQNAVYMTSSQLGSKESPNIKITKAVKQEHDGLWRSEEIATDVVMGNGGINYRSGILFCSQGTMTEPGGLVYMESKPPYATKTLIDSYYGRLFNSLNDVVLHTDGSIWFTDPIYGHMQGFRGKPQLPCQVYRFDAETGDIRVVADGFGRPNGLCFSPDETTMYVTDTHMVRGDGTCDEMNPATIYAFDVTERHGTQFLANRRVFAMADNGIPDGIKVDLQGNVYSGCGDGVHVWSPAGKLLGKIMVPGGVANFCFTTKGAMVLLNETKFWEVKIGGEREGALLANMGIKI